jgi:hypothetical protein
VVHEVRAKIDTKVVAHKDLEITVKTDGGKLGKLLISQGNIEWLPKGHSVNKRRLSWGRFAAIMENQGRPAKARKQK